VFLEEWPARDRSLALGLAAFEAAYDRGIPVDVAYDVHADGWLVAVPVVNQVDAAIERAQEKAKDADPGTRYQVFDTRVNPEYEEYADG
jgi:hypothetical protein